MHDPKYGFMDTPDGATLAFGSQVVDCFRRAAEEKHYGLIVVVIDRKSEWFQPDVAAAGLSPIGCCLSLLHAAENMARDLGLEGKTSLEIAAIIRQGGAS